MWPGPLPNFVRDDACALQRIRRDRRLEAARRGEQCVQLTFLDPDGSASTSASTPPRNLDRAYDPEESTIIHDVLGSSLPDYAILAASRAAAQAIADHNSAERRAPRSHATVDDPPDLLTPASFSKDECVAVDPLIIAAAPTLDVAHAVPFQYVAHAVPVQWFFKLAMMLSVWSVYFDGPYSHICFSCVGFVGVLLASSAATSNLLAVEPSHRA